MKKVIYVIALILWSGCGNSIPKQPDRLPDNEIAAFREAAIKMTPYIVMEDSAFHLIIDKDEALQKGISEKYYDRIQQELEYTNYLIREEYNKKGIPVEMPEYGIDTTVCNITPE